MIDWVTAYLPCENLDPLKLQDGSWCEISQTGKVIKQIMKPLRLEGSYSSSLAVSHWTRGLESQIRVTGNFAKWLQGHNLFGTSDLTSLIYAVGLKLCKILELSPTQQEHIAWRTGNVWLTRIDCTDMWKLQTQGDVLGWLNTAQFQARSRHGSPIMTGGTLYFGKHSRRWSMKFYAKLDEILRRGHQLPFSIRDREKLVELADGMLRAELTLRSPELGKLELNKACDWKPSTPYQLLMEYLNRLQVADQFMLADESIATLPKTLQAYYQLWVDGHELRGMMPKTSFYRKRRQLLEYGIDITVKHDKRSCNTVSLKSVFEQEPVQVPDWAKGTENYFDDNK